MMAKALTMIVIVTAICSAISTKPALFFIMARQMGPMSIVSLLFLSGAY